MGKKMHNQRCEDCGKARDAKLQLEEKRKQESELQAKWNKICPPIYCETDISRLHPKLIDSVLSWELKQRGIGVIGAAGAGKTRAAYLMLKKTFEAGESVDSVTSTGFAKFVSDQFSDEPEEKDAARKKIASLRKCALIFIDDLGKCKFTERVELEFYDLLEHRTSHNLPIIWTANANAKEILSMLSKDRGEPILRRLSEFSDVITIP